MPNNIKNQGNNEQAETTEKIFKEYANSYLILQDAIKIANATDR